MVLEVAHVRPPVTTRAVPYLDSVHDRPQGIPVWSDGRDRSTLVMDWSEEYVRWELPRVLASLPDRIRDPHDAGRMIAWLIGRAGQPGPVRFEPWG